MANKAVATLKGWLTKIPIKAPWKVGLGHTTTYRSWSLYLVHLIMERKFKLLNDRCPIILETEKLQGCLWKCKDLPASGAWCGFIA